VYHFLIFIAICLPESRSNSASLGFEIVVASKRLQIANVAVDVSGHWNMHVHKAKTTYTVWPLVRSLVS